VIIDFKYIPLGTYFHMFVQWKNVDDIGDQNVLSVLKPNAPRIVRKIEVDTVHILDRTPRSIYIDDGHVHTVNTPSLFNPRPEFDMCFITPRQYMHFMELHKKKLLPFDKTEQSSERSFL
jgi:hypothetical protein